MKKRLIDIGKLFGFIFLTIILLEIVFKFRVLTIGFNINLLRMILFSLSYSILMMFFIMFFKEKAVMRIIYTFTVIVTFLYLNQEIYNSFGTGFYSVVFLGVGGTDSISFSQVLSFLNDYVSSFKFLQFFYLIPIVSLYLFKKYKLISFNVEYFTLKQPLIVLILGFITFFIPLQTIDEDIDDTIANSDMDLYTYVFNSQEALKQFGLLTYTQRDFFSLFRSNPLSEYDYDLMLDDYFENHNKHLPNEYSNQLENKNFILIMAESLDTFAINEELTPNLYKLREENSYFINFYSPLYYRSTADSEFMVQTSLYPDKNVSLSMEAYIDNTFPYSLARLFSEKGYSTHSFHNYTDYFYPRSEFHTKTLGFDSYYGAYELGMVDKEYNEDTLIINHIWQSDLELMEKSLNCQTYLDDYNCTNILESDGNFFINYLTVSGHFRYSEDHEIAKLNADLVRQYEIDNEIELPDEIFYYLAANIELDKAIGYLFDELTATNHLDDTVIMIFGDHYAYGIDTKTIWEYDDLKEDNSLIDIHNVPMIIYSNDKLENKTFTNYMSTIDVIPTLANLFNLNLPYEMVFGSDALANDDNIVRFSNMSYISKYYSYDSLSEKFTFEYEDHSEGIPLSNDEKKNILTGIYDKIFEDYSYNLLVLQYDYYKEDDEEK